jgi:hypothetical protein
MFHVGRGDTERRQDHHVAALDHRVAGCRVFAVRQDDDPHLLEPRVDVGVVDDLAEEKGAAIGEAPARLVGILDRPIDAVAEAELPGELDADVSGTGLITELFEPLDDGAAVSSREIGANLSREAEALLKVYLGHGSVRIPDRATVSLHLSQH